jgi:hypothetical protein
MFVGFMLSIGRILGNSFKYELSFGLQVKFEVVLKMQIIKFQAQI